MDQGKLVLEGTPEDVFMQGDLLEKLDLGLPLIYELLSDDSLSSEEKTILEKLRQRFLKL